MTQEQPSGDPDHLALGSSERLVLRSVTADAIEVEASYEPGGRGIGTSSGPPDPCRVR